MSAQIALARPRLPHFRHCLSLLRHFPARSHFPQTVCHVPALGLDLVVKAVVRTTRVVGRPAARVVTAAAVCHFDTIVPGLVRALRSVGSMPPVPLHSASYYAIRAHEYIDMDELSHVTGVGILVTHPLLFRFRLETLERSRTEVQ